MHILWSQKVHLVDKAFLPASPCFSDRLLTFACECTDFLEASDVIMKPLIHNLVMWQVMLTAGETIGWFFIYHSWDNESWKFLASPGSSLSLSIEVDSSNRKAKFVLLGKLACIEMIPRGWHNYSLSALLLEEHKNEPVDTNAGLWALIAYDFPSCNSNARQMHIKNKCMQSME